MKELRIGMKRYYVDHVMGSPVDDNVIDHTKYIGKLFLTSVKRGFRYFYCPNKHWPDQCDKVTDPKERKEFLKKKGPCFGCGQSNLMKKL